MVGKYKINGFTIVELLIVIVVIAVLAAISVVAYNGTQNRAKAARANSDLATLRKAVELARVAQNRTLPQITGSNCTYCAANKQQALNLALTAISNASGTNLDALRNGDPWGNVYQIDENEGEGGNCTRDLLTVNPLQSGVTQIFVPTYNC